MPAEARFHRLGGAPPGDPYEETLRLQHLLAAVAQGDAAAFKTLYDLTAAKLFAVALRILRQRERAEDVLQESFVAVWNRAADYAPAKGSPMTWLTTILRHRAIDALRRSGRHPDQAAEPEEALLALVAAPGDDPSRGAELRALQNCLAELGEPQRRVLVMIYAYGYTQDEMAHRLAAPLGTVKSWVRRSLERLKRCLEG